MRHRQLPLIALFAFGLLALSACGRQSPDTEPRAEAEPAAGLPPLSAPATVADREAIEAAIADPSRLASDREEDAWRRASDVLEFLQLRPGMRVIDYMAGGGYYSELMARVVGSEGHVIAYNNEPYLKYAGDKPAQRYGNDRLTNVTQVTSAPESLSLEPESLDAALFVQSYHDLHWRSKDGTWPRTDPAQALAQLLPALKPGAVLVVVDHVAEAGSDPVVTVDTLHRIDPAIIKRDFEAAGLTFDAESPLLRNAQDDHTKPVFDESIRHRTDQIMYRFRKD